jgi:hypothetical protein
MLVYSFTYHATQRRFILVCHYPKKSWGGDPIFFHGRFRGVNRFKRLEGDVEAFKSFRTAYQAEKGKPALVIQSIRQDSSNEVEFWFGPSFGGVHFSFASLEGRTREAKVEQVNGDFLYRDSVSGAQIDPFQPFADLPQTHIGSA